MNQINAIKILIINYKNVKKKEKIVLIDIIVILEKENNQVNIEHRHMMIKLKL